MGGCGLMTSYATLGAYLQQKGSPVLAKPHGVGIFDWPVGLSLTSIGAGAAASDKALGCYYGGQPTNATDATTLSTMVVYDMLNNKFTI